MMHKLGLHENVLSSLEERKINGCIANTFIMYSSFYAWLITMMTNSFTLQHIPTTRSCESLSSPYTLSVNAKASVMFAILF